MKQEDPEGYKMKVKAFKESEKLAQQKQVCTGISAWYTCFLTHQCTGKAWSKAEVRDSIDAPRSFFFFCVNVHNTSEFHIASSLYRAKLFLQLRHCSIILFIILVFLLTKDREQVNPIKGPLDRSKSWNAHLAIILYTPTSERITYIRASNSLTTFRR